jgi:hypothetical protein
MPTLSSLPNILEPKDHGDPKPSEDGGKNLGEALSKFDFSKIDSASHAGLGSQGPDHSEVHAALASMSSDEALDYAIGQMGPVDHLDAGHFDAGQFDIQVETSHDT